ncbi:MAG: toll/interleukin-1 receptor domain-containing protein [Fuerstiella sp.]
MTDELKVFVSHSSKDKERFVEPFAARLRARGIDAWLDKWEMLPGDSLVEKIFEEGLKNAKAFVIVLSKASIRSNWVTKELSVATVNNIEKGTKLIPIILDKCEIPACLTDSVYEKINDLNSYDSEFDRLVAAIESRIIKPHLGSPPNYVTQSFPSIPGLQQQDIAVLKQLGDRVMARDRDIHEIIQNTDLRAIESDLQISPEQLQETLMVFEEKGITRESRTLSPEIIHVQLSQFGFKIYLDSFYDQFKTDLPNCVRVIVNDGLTRDTAISENANVPVVVVHFILKELEARGLLRVAEWNTGCELHSLSPQLRRMLLSKEQIL